MRAEATLRLLGERMVIANVRQGVPTPFLTTWLTAWHGAVTDIVHGKKSIGAGADELGELAHRLRVAASIETLGS